MDCPKCYGPIVYPEGLNGEKICIKCGLVVEDKPSTHTFSQWAPEWHSNWGEEDSETLKDWLTTLRVVSCQLNLPSFPYREEAARTIRKQNRMLFRSQKFSKNKRIAIAALIHLILREYDKLRPIKDISKELSLDNRAVTKYVWLLNKTLRSKEKKAIEIKRKTAVDYLYEYAGKITEDKTIIKLAEGTIIKVRRSGGNPVGLAAGAFYCACKTKKIKMSKEEIGSVFHISDRTVYSNEARIRRILASAVT